MNILIRKCHGTGNDFILIDEISNKYSFTDKDRVTLTKNLCDRQNSIGADGILFLQSSTTCDAKMRIFNSDGSEAQMCGNGLRCIGRYALELFDKTELNIETLAAQYKVVKAPSLYKDIYTVQIWLNTVNFDVDSLPMIFDRQQCLFETIEELDSNLKVTAISMTNPHIVTLVSELDNNLIQPLGEKANNLKSVFPQGVNFNFVKKIDGNSIYVRTYERGCGITKSCGTGMTASTITFCLEHPECYGKDVNVYNDGGMIKINVTKSDDTYENKFIGNASYVFDAEIEVDDNLTLSNTLSKKFYDKEISIYDEFLSYTQELTK